MPDTVGNLKRRLDNDKQVGEKINARPTSRPSPASASPSSTSACATRSTETDGPASPTSARPRKSSRRLSGQRRPATTVRGLLYQYHDGTYTTRRGEYDDWFLSGGVKFDFTDSGCVGQLAFSQSILRPDYGNLGGVVSVNDDNAGRHRAEPAAQARALDQVLRRPAVLPRAVGHRRPVSYFRLDMKDMQVTGIEVAPEDVGYDPGRLCRLHLPQRPEPARHQHQQGLHAGVRPAADLPAGRAAGVWACAARSPSSITDGARVNTAQDRGQLGPALQLRQVRLPADRQRAGQVSDQRARATRPRPRTTASSTTPPASCGTSAPATRSTSPSR